jgi:hypothetical protein
MRSLLRLPLEIATSLFFSLSIGIAAGVVAVSFSHRLGDGLKFGIPGFLIAAFGFGYFLYRTYRPAREPSFGPDVGIANAMPAKAA